MPDNYALISADCHAAPQRSEDFRPYLDEGFREDFDGWMVAQQAVLDAMAERTKASEGGLLMEMVQVHMAREEVVEGYPGSWDIATRRKELDREGIAGEVIFPNPGGIPFNAGPLGAGGRRASRAEKVAGAKAHNRWLADLCSNEPVRMAGLAMIVPYDIDDAVAEVRRSHADGLRGVLLAHEQTDIPLFNDRCYEPLWDACEELGMPLHTHSGPSPDYGDGDGARLIATMEMGWFARRPLWLMILDGVFVRHPGLRLGFTEQGIDWVPGVLSKLENTYSGSMGGAWQDASALPESPMHYWRQNCFVGASFASQPEVKIRHEIGIENVMWGSDYPHPEGSWPDSWVEMRTAFAGVPDDEIRAVVGLNAAAVYDFDLEALAPLVERIGPPEGTFTGETPIDESRYSASDYTEGSVFGGEMERRFRARLEPPAK